MARSKPYTKKLAVLDLVMLVLTGVMPWAVVMVIRELYRHSAPSKS